MPQNPKIPHEITALKGLNKLVNPALIDDSEFNTLQNFTHKVPGALSKRFGSTAELTSAQLTGSDSIDGITRHQDQDGKSYTLYYCPDADYRRRGRG